jgi:acetyl esterase
MSFFLLLAAGNVFADGVDTVGYTVTTFVYKAVGGEELKLDVFSPVGSLAAPKARPAIVLFHGGSWISGDKSQLDWQCRYFVQQGMVAVTANYRLLGKDTGIVDAASAVWWFRNKAASLGVDTGKIILGGASAGGHLATMAVLAGFPARALVLLNPAYSLTDDPAIEPYRMAGASFPPAVFFYGSKDKWKPAGDSLKAQLTKAGVHCESWVAEGQVHGFFNRAPYNIATCLRAQHFLAALGLLTAISDDAAASGLLKRED